MQILSMRDEIAGNLGTMNNSFVIEKQGIFVSFLLFSCPMKEAYFVGYYQSINTIILFISMIRDSTLV